MKRTQRVIMSLLLVLSLVGVPVSQVMAVSYDATEDWSSQDLYPGDDLTGIEEGVSVTQDGEDISISDGTWKNVSEDLVYQATKQDGSITLTAAGYSLTVEGGSSHGEDGESSASYESGETVTIVADEPEEGSVFTGWTTESEDLLDDETSETVTFTMPAASVTVKANFAETAAPAEEEEAAPAEDGEDAVPAEEEEAAPAESEEAEPAEEEEVSEVPADTEAEILPLDAGEGAEDAAEAVDEEPAQEPEDADESAEESSETEELTDDYSLQVLADEAEASDEEEEEVQDVAPEIKKGEHVEEVTQPVLSEDKTEWTFTAKAKNPTTEDTNYQFAGWTATYEKDGEVKDLKLGGATGSEIADADTPLSFSAEIDADAITVTANYNQLYEIRIEGGRIESDQYWYLPGEEVKITIIADVEEGGTFDYWDLITDPDLGNEFQPQDFNCDLETTELKFTMPSATVILSANVDYDDDDNGGSGEETEGVENPGVVTTAYRVTVENGRTAYEEYYPGEIVTISADYPTTNQEFKSWSLLEGQTELENAYRWETTFTMPEGDVTVAATYKDGPSYWIEGITEGATYESEERLTFTPVGGGMDNTDPNLGDIRYVPTSYTIGNVSNTWSEGPYTTSMSIKKAGEYTLTVCFTKQLWNGSEWEDDGTTALSTVTFYIEGESGEYGSVNTGDTTPVTLIVVIAVAACLIFIILLVVFIRRRRSGSQE